MRTSLWRAIALGCIVVTLTLIVGDLLHRSPPGTFGITKNSTGTASTQVVRVEAGSAAARAGIVAGDRLTPAPGAANWFVFNAPFAAVGTPVTVDVENAGSKRRVTIVSGVPTNPSGVSGVGFLVSYEVLRVVMIVVALLIVLWRPDRPDARALATFFIAFAFGFLSHPAWYPWFVDAALLFLRPVAVLFAVQQALRFATIFPKPDPQGVRPWLNRFGTYVLAASLGTLIVSNALPTSALAAAITNAIITAAFVLLVISIVVALVLGYRKASGADRPRMRWIALSLLVGFGGLLPTGILEQSGFNAWWVFVPGLALVAIPLGVTYAMFRHRMFDVGFVVSRALVFTGLSLIVVLAFSALEWLIGKSLVTAGHVQSVSLEAALALGLGLSMDRLRSRVDHAVDNVFFRDRHKAEQALQRLSEECTYITNGDVLATRVLDALQRYARADGAALYLRAEGGEYRVRRSTLPGPASVDENDPAIVSLRASRAPVNVNDGDSLLSNLPGIIAFPLLVRGDLIGILCCGPRANGEAYDPDERRILASLTHAVGGSFAAIEASVLRAAMERLLRGDLSLDDVRHLRSGLGESAQEAGRDHL